MKNLLVNFKKYLKLKNLSKVSVKNYISDIRQFLKWAAKNNLKPSSTTNFFHYRTYLTTENTPVKTINRYLCSLRCFGDFLQKAGLSPINPANKIENIKKTNNRDSKNKKQDKLLHQFKQSLIKERLNPVTIKNYISDTKQFLEFFYES